MAAAANEGEQLYRIVEHCTCSMDSIVRDEYRLRLVVDDSELRNHFDREVIIGAHTPLDEDVVVRITPIDVAQSIMRVKQLWARRKIDAMTLTDLQISEESIAVYVVMIDTRLEEIIDEMRWSTRHLFKGTMMNLTTERVSARDSMIVMAPLMRLSKLCVDYQALRYMFVTLRRRMRGNREERIV